MTNSVQEKIAVMQAYANGEKIEVRKAGSGNNWTPVSGPVWDWSAYTYRVIAKTFEVGGKYEWRGKGFVSKDSPLKSSELKCVYIGQYQGVFEAAAWADLSIIATEHLKDGNMVKLD